MDEIWSTDIAADRIKTNQEVCTLSGRIIMNPIGRGHFGYCSTQRRKDYDWRNQNIPKTSTYQHLSAMLFGKCEIKLSHEDILEIPHYEAKSVRNKIKFERLWKETCAVQEYMREVNSKG